MVMRTLILACILLAGFGATSEEGDKEDRRRRDGAAISAMNAREVDVSAGFKGKGLSPVWVIAHMSGSAKFGRDFIKHCGYAEATKAQSASSFFVCLRHSALFPLKLQYASLYDLKVDAKRVDGADGLYWHVYFFVPNPDKKLTVDAHWRFAVDEKQFEVATPLVPGDGALEYYRSKAKAVIDAENTRDTITAKNHTKTVKTIGVGNVSAAVLVLAPTISSSAEAREVMRRCRLAETTDARAAGGVLAVVRAGLMFPLNSRYDSLGDLKSAVNLWDSLFGEYRHVYLFKFDSDLSLTETDHQRYKAGD